MIKKTSNNPKTLSKQIFDEIIDSLPNNAKLIRIAKEYLNYNSGNNELFEILKIGKLERSINEISNVNSENIKNLYNPKQNENTTYGINPYEAHLISIEYKNTIITLENGFEIRLKKANLKLIEILDKNKLNYTMG